MPGSLIEVRREYSEDQVTGIIDAIHDSLVAAFTIPSADKHVRLVIHDPNRFATPPTLANPEFYTLVTIDCFAGRSVHAKRTLCRGIVRRLVAFGIPEDHVTILLRESATENWGIAGGQAACDIDLGYSIDV